MNKNVLTFQNTYKKMLFEDLLLHEFKQRFHSRYRDKHTKKNKTT